MGNLCAFSPGHLVTSMIPSGQSFSLRLQSSSSRSSSSSGFWFPKEKFFVYCKLECVVGFFFCRKFTFPDCFFVSNHLFYALVPVRHLLLVLPAEAQVQAVGHDEHLLGRDIPSNWNRFCKKHNLNLLLENPQTLNAPVSLDSLHLHFFLRKKIWTQNNWLIFSFFGGECLWSPRTLRRSTCKCPSGRPRDAPPSSCRGGTAARLRKGNLNLNRLQS